MPQSLRTGVPERFSRKQNRGGPVMSKYFLSAAVALMVGVAAPAHAGPVHRQDQCFSLEYGFLARC